MVVVGSQDRLDTKGLESGGFVRFTDESGNPGGRKGGVL